MVIQGHIDEKELLTFGEKGSKLGGHPDRNKVVGTKVTYENPDYTPQSQTKREEYTPQSVKRKGGKLKKKKKVSKRKQMGGFLLEPPIEQI